MTIFRKKELNDASQQTALVRSLTTIDLISLGIGAIVGTGIFTISGIAISSWAGPAISISFIIAAFAILLNGLIFAEYASKIPQNGGPYAYMYVTLGEVIGWLSGWLLILEFIFAGSSVASGWSGYVRGFLQSAGIDIPVALSAPFNPSQGSYIDIIAVIVVLAVIGIVAYDSKKALRLNFIIVALKLLAILLFIVVGVFYIHPKNWNPFMPFGFFGIKSGTGIIPAAALVFFSYLGFETISMAVDETKEPQKHIPRGILGAIALSTLLYVVVTIVLTGVVPYSQLGVRDPIAFALRFMGQPIISNIITLIAIMALLTVLISMVYSLSRLIYSISKDGLLPKFLQNVRTERHTPQNAVVFVGVFTVICSGFFSLEFLAQLVNISTLLYLIFMDVGLFKLRNMKFDNHQKHFSTPFYPLTPIISMIVCVYLMLQFSISTWIGFFVIVCIGLLIYLFYGYKHSKLNK